MLPYHVYMDLDVINNDYTSTKHPQLRFEETRNTPFLDGDSADYFCSILRFSIQTGNSLPIFIPQIQVGQSDPNLTIYKVIIEREIGGNIVEGSAYVQYESQSQATESVKPPLIQQDLSNTYYHVNSYHHFIDMINDALVAALANMRDIATSWRSIAAPFIEWDAASCTATLLLPTDNEDSFGSMRVYFSTRLCELFLPCH